MFGALARSHAGLAAAAACWLAGFAAVAQNGSPTVASVDVYGSRAFDSAQLRAEFGAELAQLAALGIEAQNNPNANLQRLESEANALEAKLKNAMSVAAPLAYFEVSMTTDFGSPQRFHVMVSVVEQADAARRMPFREGPTAEIADPDGLLAVWDEYQEKVFALAFAGTSLRIDAGDCPVLHCIAPFGLPELEPYLARLNDGARRHEEILYKIATESADATLRANALFVLAHTNDAERLMPVLARAIYDPAGGVRNNAMRVLMSLAQARPELEFPLQDLIAAYDFPTSSDRNKAGYTLAALAAQPRYRDAIRAGAVPVALRVLRLDQPNNHDPAYQILKQVSGESFGERDYAAWDRWAAEHL